MIFDGLIRKYKIITLGMLIEMISIILVFDDSVGKECLSSVKVFSLILSKLSVLSGMGER